MTVPELQIKYAKPGMTLEIIPYSIEKTLGESWIPFTGMPKDLENLDDVEYSRRLNTKEVVKYESISNGDEPTKVFSLTGRFKGYQYRITIAVWMHDAEMSQDSVRA